MLGLRVSPNNIFFEEARGLWWFKVVYEHPSNKYKNSERSASTNRKRGSSVPKTPKNKGADALLDAFDAPHPSPELETWGQGLDHARWTVHLTSSSPLRPQVSSASKHSDVLLFSGWNASA